MQFMMSAMEASRRATVPSKHIRPCTASGGTTRNLAHTSHLHPPLHPSHTSFLGSPSKLFLSQPFSLQPLPEGRRGEVSFPLHPSLTSLPCISPLPVLLNSSCANPSPSDPSEQAGEQRAISPTHLSHPPTFPQHLLRSVSGPEGEVKLHPGGSFREAEGQQVFLGDDMATGELSDCRLRHSEREEQLLLEFRHLG